MAAGINPTVFRDAGARHLLSKLMAVIGAVLAAIAFCRNYYQAHRIGVSSPVANRMIWQGYELPETATDVTYYADFGGCEAEFEIVTLAVDGNRVFTERIDRLVVQGKRVELPVAGVFEIDGDGKISVWRDYFDLASLIKQIG